MTDRFNALTVVLTDDIREDDAEQIIKAIEMVKGVLTVKGNVSNYEDHIAQDRVRHELRIKLWEVLKK